MAPQVGQIIFSKSTSLISFGWITRPHFGQVVFSEVSTLSQSIFLVMADKISRLRHLFALSILTVGSREGR